MSNIFETESASLQHHGILGQKWGVRRFENKNGTLTPAGRKRYGTDENGDYKKVGGPGKVKLPNSKSLNRLADETQKDADISRKSGYEAEANSLQKKADDLRSKAKEKEIEEANRRKKIIIAGAAIAGTALAAYGGYKMYQINQQNKATSQAISNATKALNDFKAAQNSMNRPNSLKPTSSGSSQNAAPKIDRATVSHTPIDRVQVDRTPIDRIQIDRFEPDRFGFEKFSAAADMNDSFVQDLLKKNSSKLKGY